MNAEIITCGTELLLGQIEDTNSSFISRKLAEAGINVYFRTTAGDNAGRLVLAIKAALQRADAVIITGGLGPTVDDITREAVSQCTGRKIVIHEDILLNLNEFFKKRGIKMADSNMAQAGVPENAEIIKNDRGTAPGFILEHEGKTIACVPGVPYEMKPMVTDTIIPYLMKKSGEQASVIKYVSLKIAGMAESAVNDLIKDLFESYVNPSIGILAHHTEIELRITAKAANISEADKMLNKVKLEIKKRLGENLYGENEEALHGVLANTLKSKKLTISTAESCTSGIIASKLTQSAGATSYYIGGINTYSNEVKTDILGVDPYIIQDYGAVSRECACEMALKCAELFKTDCAISVTGIAWPGGGTPEKPVGLVYIGINYKGAVIVNRFIFSGSREIVRQRAAVMALFEMLKTINRGGVPV
ncbi:MAG: competence/damage-inducible protein A [Candidatus Goldbacteria bacterium]|nr:competence/damage-inducible protein A [Candidatus Goldiibacteriota bacterium]